MKAKTFDGQTARFIASLLDSVPRDISGEKMQDWIQNPQALKQRMKKMLDGPLYDKKYKRLKRVTVPAFADAEALKKRLAELFEEGSEHYPKRLIRHILDSGTELPPAGQQWDLGTICTKDQWSSTREAARRQILGPVESLVAAVLLAESGALVTGKGTLMRYQDAGKGTILHFNMENIQLHYTVGLAVTIDNAGKLGLKEYTWGGNHMDPWGVVPDDDDQFIIKC